MSKSGVVQDKTNTHKSTLKAHIKSQIASAAPKSRGQARRGWLTRQDVLNTRTYTELRALIASARLHAP